MLRTRLDRFLGKRFKRLLLSRQGVVFLQRHGIDVMGRTYESPIPDLQVLRQKGDDFWNVERPLPGVDLNMQGQLRFMKETLQTYVAECNFPVDPTSIPHEYYVRNNAFGYISAAVLHCFIRHFKPKLIIEVGAGNSTYVSTRAALMNGQEGHDTQLIAIEPYPRSTLVQGFPGLTRLIQSKVEDVDPGLFYQLGDGDILFIDSSHVVRTGGDVNRLYLEILPALQKGVLVHIHDIFLPFEYPRHRIIDKQTFWTEQYLLQTFLAFNQAFQVLWAGSYLYKRYTDMLWAVFPPPAGLNVNDMSKRFLDDNYRSSSFWMVKIN